MIKELIKLADQLDKMGRANVANEIDNIISKASDPTDAPYLFEIGQGTPSEFQLPEENDFEAGDNYPEVIAPKEIVDAAYKFIANTGYKMTSIKWVTTEELIEQGWGEGDEGDEGCWIAKSLPGDGSYPSGNVDWLLWEVTPDNYGYDNAIPIKGTVNRLYGES